MPCCSVWAEPNVSTMKILTIHGMWQKKQENKYTLDILDVAPSQDSSGKWRFIGVPY